MKQCISQGVRSVTQVLTLHILSRVIILYQLINIVNIDYVPTVATKIYCKVEFLFY